jgi:hypothetical protein
MGDRGKAGGQLDALCCARQITIEQTADEEEIVCDPMSGAAETIYTNPRMTITLEEANFDEVPLMRSLNLTRAINTYGYDIIGNGSDPNTTPTAIAHVDGPHAPTYVANEATVYLHNGLIIENSVVAWTRNSDGSFSNVAGFVADYADAETNLPTGELHYTDAADSSPIYFTYKYNPSTPGTIELANPWTILQSEAEMFMKIYHNHANGELWIFNIWKVRPRLDATLDIKQVTGDRFLTVPMVFVAAADRRYHPDDPLMKIQIDSQDRSITPDFGCDGALWATPIG